MTALLSERKIIILRKELTKDASTIEEAQALIAQEFGVSPEKIQFEVLQEPQKKTLGLFGGSPAVVRGVLAETADGAAIDYLRGVLACMGASDVDIVSEKTENGYLLRLDGKDIGFIIGRRGETLDALQYLAGLVANRVDNSYCRIAIDIGNYREKREQTLTALAKRMSNQVLKSGRRATLEPMNPYERRVIHTAVQEIEGVTSWSVGSDTSRHIIIGLEGQENTAEQPSESSRPSRRRSRGGKNNRGNRASSEAAPRERSERTERRPARSDVAPDRPARQVREFVPRNNPLPTVDDPAPSTQRTESEKEKSAVLYGRIDL